MSRFSLAASTALVTLFAAGAVRADVTADDVWRNIRAYAGAFGGSLSVETARSGNTLKVGELAMHWGLPMDAGRVSLTQSGFDLVEQGDGTVAVVIPQDFAMHFAVEPMDKPRMAGTGVLGHDGMVIVASGRPGDVTYTSSVGSMTVTVTDLEIPEVEAAEAEISVTMTDFTSEQRVVVDKVVSLTGSTQYATQDMVMNYVGPGNANIESTAKISGASATYALDLPRNGMDVLNLAAAIRDGLKGHVASEMQGYETHQSIRIDGERVQEQHNSFGLYTFGMSLDRDGVSMEGTGKDAKVRAYMPEVMPLDLEFAAESTAGRFVLPISAGEQLHEAAISVDVTGLTVGDMLWGLIDPGMTIPRDPATLRLDLTAQVKSYLDWLDFMTVGASMEAGEVPGELHAVTLKDFTLEAAGASLTGSGEATFDNTDLETFKGFPKPTGTLDMTLKGANALIDRLTGIGALSDDEAMGARMGIGMMAKPAPELGEDVLKSHIELTGEGHVMANGIRMR